MDIPLENVLCVFWKDKNIHCYLKGSYVKRSYQLKDEDIKKLTTELERLEFKKTVRDNTQFYIKGNIHIINWSDECYEV